MNTDIETLQQEYRNKHKAALFIYHRVGSAVKELEKLKKELETANKSTEYARDRLLDAVRNKL